MSEFHVTPEKVIEATRPMHGISTALADSHAQIGAHADAAAGCISGGDHVQGSFAAWSAALPQFAAAADRMILSMGLAAGGYRTADETVASVAQECA
jgi:hypothetical protein